MEKVTLYKTKDNIVHRTYEEARDHCFDKVEVLIIELLKQAEVKNPQIYAARMLKHADDTERFNNIGEWLIDAANKGDL